MMIETRSAGEPSRCTSAACICCANIGNPDSILYLSNRFDPAALGASKSWQDASIIAMNLTSKRVLVTGADGFIGSHLVELLVDKGADVTALALYNSFNNWGWLEGS